MKLINFVILIFSHTSDEVMVTNLVFPIGVRSCVDCVADAHVGARISVQERA